jgi:hypothetical protein
VDAGNQRIRWEALLEQLSSDLSYFSDRWCYERYVCIKREWLLFLAAYDAQVINPVEPITIP